MTRAGCPTVLIVDDEPDIRLLLRVILESAAGNFDVIAEAADGAGAIYEFEKLDPPRVPDVVVLDNQMPGRPGIEIAAEMLGVYAALDKTGYEQLPALVLDAVANAQDTRPDSERL